ncbi:MAG: hypothetical protein WC455_12925 [Dehalococcoidia bacterium]|jgi:hypothetical protein
MSILSDARLLCEDLQEYYQAKENGYHPECEPLIVSKCAKMLPELLAYAEMHQAQAIELKAKIDYPNYDELPEEDRVEKRYIGEKGDFHELHYRGKRTLRQEAAKELSADLPPRITEEEKAAISKAAAYLDKHLVGCVYDEDENKKWIEAVNVLRGLL